MTEKRQSYPFHPAADVFPLLSAVELKQLADDIAKRGLMHPILVFEGKILDGRNRYKACQIAKVEPTYQILDLKQVGPSAIEFVVSQNLRRRQMNPSQTAMAAAVAMPTWIAEGKKRSISNLRRGKNNPEKIPISSRGASASRLSKIFGVSSRYITAAVKLNRHAKDLAKRVFEGELPITGALRICREQDLAQRRQKERAALKNKKVSIQVHQQDIQQLTRNIKLPPIDLIITDPPFASETLPLWENLGQLAGQVLKPGGYLAVMSGIQFLPNVINALQVSGLAYYWTICVHLTGANGRRHGLRLINAWRPIFVFYKPPFQVPARQVLDHFAGCLPSVKNHKWEQTADVFGEIVKDFTCAGEWVLDPFVGSGAVLEACQKLKRNGIGSDVDPATVAMSKKRMGL